MEIDDANHRHLRANISRLMVEKGLSLAKLADFAGMGRGRLSDMLAGRGSPTLRTMTRIADALGVSVEKLLHPPDAN